MKRKLLAVTIIVTIVLVTCGTLWFKNYNKVVGIVYGAEANKIIIGEVAYIMVTEEPCPYSVYKK